MNKFDLRKYFEFNVLLEQPSEDKQGLLYFIDIDKNLKFDERKYQTLLDILELLKKSANKIEPVKRLTIVKNRYGKIEEKEDENGERFLFRSFEDMNIFKTQLVNNGIKFFAQGYTDDDPNRKEDK